MARERLTGLSNPRHRRSWFGAIYELKRPERDDPEYRDYEARELLARKIRAARAEALTEQYGMPDEERTGLSRWLYRTKWQDALTFVYEEKHGPRHSGSPQRNAIARRLRWLRKRAEKKKGVWTALSEPNNRMFWMNALFEASLRFPRKNRHIPEVAAERVAIAEQLRLGRKKAQSRKEFVKLYGYW